ncbi:MAG: pyridoxine 5'-phosphate synthase [Candidatus Omnitrophota bacterium]|jgi:pyridoxine 5-phosphate synthase
MIKIPKLGVNIDHSATLRQARGGAEPDPVEIALLCEKAGCDSIVAHLREDRRHINDNDVIELRNIITTKFNLEMSMDTEIVDIALKIGPDQVTLVPEKRQELTTEGGLSVVKHEKRLGRIIELFNKKGIDVSVFIDPDKKELRAAIYIGIGIIEIHTGSYSLAENKKYQDKEFNKIKAVSEYAMSKDIVVNAGHGLNYENARRIARIKGINELNIGHSIISRALSTGIYKAVKDMKALVTP